MKFGVTTAYYGPRSPAHAECVRALKRAGVPVSEVHGSPYPEMARAEMARMMLEARLDVLVFLDAHVTASVDTVIELARHAHKLQAVVTTAEYIGPRGWDPHARNRLSLAAVPLCVLERLAEQDDRYYGNSAVLDTGSAKGSRPFFSPFDKAGKVLVDGVYCPEDIAFLHRASLVSEIHWRGDLECDSQSVPRYTERVTNPTPREGLPRYAICIPSFGGQIHEQFRALWELEKHGMTIIECNGCPYIDVVRSRLKQIAIDELGLDGCFYIDHDIVFAPEDVLKLCEEAERRQAMVGAAYCMRTSARAVIGALSRPRGDEVLFFEGGDIEPALYTGMGFTAVPKSIFKRLDPTLPTLRSASWELKPYFALDVTGSFYCGEDVSFCNRVHGLSVEQLSPEDWKVERTGDDCRVFLDTRIRIFHQGSYDYGLEDAGTLVPRVSTLRVVLCETREEANDMVQDTTELPVQVQRDALNMVRESIGGLDA